MATAICGVEAPPAQGWARVESEGSKRTLGVPTQHEALSPGLGFGSGELLPMRKLGPFQTL